MGCYIRLSSGVRPNATPDPAGSLRSNNWNDSGIKTKNENQKLRLLCLLTGLVVFFFACAWTDGEEQGSLAPPADSDAPATSQESKYLIFWSDPEKAGELAERIGMKGDGKTRLLGFGVPNATYELEALLPDRIRSAFAARASTTWR